MLHELQVSDLFYRNKNTDKRIVVNQGGSRSGKTYSLLQCLIVQALEAKGKIYSIVRKTLPALKATAIRDFIEILNAMEIYDERNHNKSDHIYTLNGNEFEFFSLDQPQKVRGRKRDILFINEANELHLEDWRQLILRTTERAYLDYNPSDEHHWIYDDVLTREDCEFIKSTYLDNPFLPEETIKEIERLKEVDENFWRVYGLGERGISQELVYTHWVETKDVKEGENYCYGIDFGYNNPTSIVKVTSSDGCFYAEEILYQSGLTTNDLIQRIKQLCPNVRKEFFADSAEPKTIEEMHRAGINVKAADKGVNEGIDKVKSSKLFVSSNSTNLIKELRNYKWKVDKNGKKLDEPVKFNDHACDAMRYAIYNFAKSNIRTYRPKGFAAGY